MNKIEIHKVQGTNIKASEIPTLLEKNGVTLQSVETVDWPKEYPYCPTMKFRMAYTENAILIHYMVSEQSVRAIARQDHDAVWEDSCVEFFSCPANDGRYYNIECNCTGKLIVAVGEGRNHREPAPTSVMSGVERWASLGEKPFETINQPTKWEIALMIPFTTFFKHEITSLQGLTITGNFYKCGDKLPEPHFISWNPIDTPTPDFHRPEFFGQIEFK